VFFFYDFALRGDYSGRARRLVVLEEVSP